MEEMMKIHNTCMSKRFRHQHHQQQQQQQQQQQPRLGMHTDSHVISKFTMKPKIRIVHIFAPEIIKTDAANFRELVQRLTGKPSPSDRNKKSSSRKRPPPAARSGSSAETSSDHHINVNYHHHHVDESVLSRKPNLFYNNHQQNNLMITSADESSEGLQSSEFQSSDYGSHGSGLKEEEEEVIWGGDKGFFTDFEGLIRGIGLPTQLDMFGDNTTNTYDRSYAV